MLLPAGEVFFMLTSMAISLAAVLNGRRIDKAVAILFCGLSTVLAFFTARDMLALDWPVYLPISVGALWLLYVIIFFVTQRKRHTPGTGKGEH